MKLGGFASLGVESTNPGLVILERLPLIVEVGHHVDTVDHIFDTWLLLGLQGGLSSWAQ